MTALELTRFQLDDISFQLAKTFEPFTEEQWIQKPAGHAMSPAETVEHLCEAYEAFVASTEGRKWSWGAYAIADKSKANCLAVFNETRCRAIEKALESDDPERLQNAHAYMTAHDAYHVGQLCSANVAWNPSWDPYSIYNH